MNTDFVHHLRFIRGVNRYSQHGEELILQYIFENIGTTDKFFVDYGAGDGYALSNVRSLKENFGWNGLMLDADPRGSADVMREFITPENICDLFEKYLVPKQFDLLSSDIDSCDFQLLQAILPNYRPRVIVAEWNSNLDENLSVYLKYEPGYYWDNTSKYGFSFLAGKKLMQEHGYTLVHNNAELNQFFIADEVLGQHLELEIPYRKAIVHPINPKAEWVTY